LKSEAKATRNREEKEIELELEMLDDEAERMVELGMIVDPIKM
jgi:hypothetical protein